MQSHRTASAALALTLVLVPAVTGSAQTPDPPVHGQVAATQPAPADPLGRSTPFGTVRGFIRAAERQDFTGAAEYLDTRVRGARAEGLARQLYTVLSRGLTFDLDRLSRSREGALQSGLPPTRNRIGIAETRAGDVELFVDRIDRQGLAPIWLFAADTLDAVPEAAAALSAFDPEAYIPRVLIDNTLLSQPLYRWIAVPLLAALAWLLGTVLARMLVPLLRPVVRRVIGAPDVGATTSLDAPLRLILVGLAIRLLSTMSISLQGRQFWTRVGSTVIVVGGAWLAILFNDLIAEAASRQLLQRRLHGRIAVLRLVSRLSRVLIIVIAALALLYRAGVDLTAILTGVGIGGLGLALAAQKTLENFFGGIMIIADEPIRVGDVCRIADQTGTVEDIGARSTRIRTLSRTVLAVPNGELASMNIENLSLRDKFWLHHTVGVRYETSADQLRHLLAHVRAMLGTHPKVEREGARIRFVGFGGSSLDLEIFAYVHAADTGDFLAIQEDILLRVMDLVGESGTSIAFPSQTTYLARDTRPDVERKAAAEGQVQQWRERGELPFPDFRPG